MTPQQFIAKWQGCQLAERAFYTQHFNDLCTLGRPPHTRRAGHHRRHLLL